MLYKKTTPYDFTSVWSVTAPSAFRLLFNWATEWKGRKRGSWVLTDTRAHLHLQWIIKSSGRHFVDVFLIFPPKTSCLFCLFSSTSSLTTERLLLFDSLSDGANGARDQADWDVVSPPTESIPPQSKAHCCKKNRERKREIGKKRGETPF